MSGAEAIAAVQLIDACIGIAKTVVDIGRAVSDAQGLPPTLRQLLEKLPVIEELLESARENIEEGKLAEDASKKAQPILKQCEQALDGLRGTFRKACPKDGDNHGKRLWKGAKTVFLGRNSKAQKLLMTIEDNLKLLEQKEVCVIGDKLDELREITKSLDHEDGGKYVHAGSGPFFANEGGSPSNYVNSGSGEQFINHGTYNRGPSSSWTGDTYIPGGFNLQGNFAGVTINSVAAGRPNFVGIFSHSSLAPVQTFVPQTQLRDEIRARLHNGAADGTTTALAVWGLGGAGKTQLLLDYVRHYRAAYEAIFWIEARQKDTLERDFVELYYTLFGVHNVAGAETVGAENAVTAVKSYFSGRQGPWLFVFDGADAIDDETARAYIPVKHYIPNVERMYVIIASRNGVAKGLTQLGGVRVGDMEEAQAVELFYKCSELYRESEETTEIVAIVKELGLLALAITLAGTYVGTTDRLRSDIKIYLPEYQQRRHQLLSRFPEAATQQYTESVLTTWETSYEAIAQSSCPEAAVLLTMLSFLSPDDIFLGFFGTEIDLPAAAIPNMDIYKSEDCFRTLERYEMVQWKRDQKSFAMHKLVHAWGFERLDDSRQQGFAIAMLELVAQAIAGCNNRPKDKLRLVPHIVANHETLPVNGQMSAAVWREAVRVIQRIGIFLYHVGRFREARTVQRYVLNECKQRIGEEHCATLVAMGNLAIMLTDQG